MKHLRPLTKYFWKYRLRLVVGIFFIIISNYFGVLAPQVTGFVLDYVQRTSGLPGYVPGTRKAAYDVLVMRFIDWVGTWAQTPGRVVLLSGLTILVLALLRGLFMFFMRQTIIVMSRHIEYDQKNEVYDHYQLLHTEFYKQNSVGDLMSRMAEDVSRVRMFTGPAIMYLINLVTLISLSVYFMYRRDPELTLYVLLPLPILALTIYRVNTIIHKKSESLQRSLSALTTNAQQSYSGIRVIKSFAQEGSMHGYFTGNSDTYKKNAVDLARVEALYFPSMNLLIGLSTLMTIFIGGIYYWRGEISINTIVEFVIYINLLTFPVSAIGWTASMIQRAAASQQRLNEFLQIKPGIPLTGNRLERAEDIRFDGISYTYPHTGIHAIRDLDLHIKRGEKVAVLGRTGSGKSTLAQLLLRALEPDSGTITIGGQDVSTLHPQELRRAIGYVPQDGFLFSDTIEANIAFGAPDAGTSRVQEAAGWAAVAAEIEEFPHSYQTTIGERGVSLSGGQKQRVSIARALLKNSPILILDDCLSAVDTRTERKILTHLQEYLEEKTAIVITHRVSTLIRYDQIIVLEGGRIAERGTHETLMGNGGLYAQMYRKQRQEEDAEGGGGPNLAVDKT